MCPGVSNSKQNPKPSWYLHSSERGKVGCTPCVVGKITEVIRVRQVQEHEAFYWDLEVFRVHWRGGHTEEGGSMSLWWVLPKAPCSMASLGNRVPVFPFCCLFEAE